MDTRPLIAGAIAATYMLALKITRQYNLGLARQLSRVQILVVHRSTKPYVPSDG